MPSNRASMKTRRPPFSLGHGTIDSAQSSAKNRKGRLSDARSRHKWTFEGYLDGTGEEPHPRKAPEPVPHRTYSSASERSATPMIRATSLCSKEATNRGAGRSRSESSFYNGTKGTTSYGTAELKNKYSFNVTATAPMSSTMDGHRGQAGDNCKTCITVADGCNKRENHESTIMHTTTCSQEVLASHITSESLIQSRTSGFSGHVHKVSSPAYTDTTTGISQAYETESQCMAFRTGDGDNCSSSGKEGVDLRLSQFVPAVSGPSSHTSDEGKLDQLMNGQVVVVGDPCTPEQLASGVASLLLERQEWQRQALEARAELKVLQENCEGMAKEKLATPAASNTVKEPIEDASAWVGRSRTGVAAIHSFCGSCFRPLDKEEGGRMDTIMESSLSKVVESAAVQALETKVAALHQNLMLDQAKCLESTHNEVREAAVRCSAAEAVAAESEKRARAAELSREVKEIQIRNLESRLAKKDADLREACRIKSELQCRLKDGGKEVGRWRECLDKVGRGNRGDVCLGTIGDIDTTALHGVSMRAEVDNSSSGGRLIQGWISHLSRLETSMRGSCEALGAKATSVGESATSAAVAAAAEAADIVKSVAGGVGGPGGKWVSESGDGGVAVLGVGEGVGLAIGSGEGAEIKHKTSASSDNSLLEGSTEALKNNAELEEFWGSDCTPF